MQFNLAPADNARLANLCGVYDDNIKTLSELLDVRIHRRGECFRVTGSGDHPAQVRKVLNQLYTQANNPLDSSRIRKLIATHATDEPTLSTEVVGVRPHNPAQAHYLATISNNDVTFGIGASGTGKTFLAMACALSALAQEVVHHIVLVRPAVEAGENLGFLPGDSIQKVNPYLRPLQDAIHEISNGNSFAEHMRNNRIELAPLAYMRGRTLTNSFVILDEAQNTTCAQMQMFLTRLGPGSRCVVTGDESQIDLPRPADSGLLDILRRIDGVKGCAVVRFRSRDTMRHPVVSRILDVYGQP